eukprot:comp23636_c1_seq1/m.40301 comp23636_c1_seq1/g.40301  ORF comp23636_c1_seq1/g.40301 comp23636_c1_seq1/m.40301 type:complete len:1534 (-) comp23636_c1_seq1:538-5139(-)
MSLEAVAPPGSGGRGRGRPRGRGRGRGRGAGRPASVNVPVQSVAFTELLQGPLDTDDGKKENAVSPPEQEEVIDESVFKALSLSEEQVRQVEQAVVRLKAQGKGLEDPQYRLLLRLLRDQGLVNTGATGPRWARDHGKTRLGSLGQLPDGSLTAEQQAQMHAQLQTYRLLARELPADQSLKETAGAIDDTPLDSLAYPEGADPLSILEDHRHAVLKAMHARRTALESLPRTLPPKVHVAALSELMCLRVCDIQNKVRHEMYGTINEPPTAVVLGDFRSLRRPRKLVLRTVKETLEQERAMQKEEEMRKVHTRQSYINSVLEWHADFTAFHKQAREVCRSVAKAIANYFAKRDEEKRRQEEMQEKARMRALMENDEETYRQLVKEKKDSRLAYLLEKTDGYIVQFLTLVKERRAKKKREEDKQKKKQQAVEASGDKEIEVEDALEEIQSGPSNLDEESTETSAKNYYLITHELGEKITKQPSILVNGQLKDYQMQGLEWMVSLYNNDLNGILADEMGLGKTIQSISLIAYLIEAKKNNGPYLIVVPLSTLTNWQLEFMKWVPSVKVIVYKGKPKERLDLQAEVRKGDFNVLLTTYEYVLKDKGPLGRQSWAYLIIDEGHRMRNHDSKLTQVLLQNYKVARRLLLTGTPLQNKLPELWGLMNFLLPDVFNSCSTFEEWFNRPFANTGETAELNSEETILVIRGLHKVLRPFLLRRLKSQVESQLPSKTEYVIKVGMTALQSSVYNQLKKNSMILCEQGGANKMRAVNNAMMHLRKICNHPYLFDEIEDAVNPSKLPAGPNLYRVSGKFELLDRMFAKLKAAGHRVLLFCQMTRLLVIMEDYLNWRGYKYLCLTGTTKAEDRGAMLSLFNAKDSEYFVFLLSTRAGGLGLNLQTADTVIIFDSDWNPFQDQQAQDRAHRIGQKNEVRVLRLVSMGTVEEYILEAAQRKLHMDAKVIQAGRFDQRTSAEIQRKILEELVSKDDELGKGMDIEPHTLEEVNEMLARTEEEYALFQKIDKEMIESDGGWEKRLMQESEVPKVYLASDEAIRKIAKPNILETHGRGRREHAQVSYAENITENQFLKAVEEGITPQEFAAEKRRRKDLKAERRARREEKKAKREARLQRRQEREQRQAEAEKARQEREERRKQRAERSSRRTKRKRGESESESEEEEGEDGTERKTRTRKRRRGEGESDASESARKKRGEESESEESVSEEESGGRGGQKRKRRAEDSSDDSQPLMSSGQKQTPSTRGRGRGRRGRPPGSGRGRGRGRIPVSQDVISSSSESESASESDSELDQPESNAGPQLGSNMSLLAQLDALYQAMRTLKDDDGDLVCELFLEAPDRAKYPDYYDVITNPMALDTIKDKIESGEYLDVDSMEADVDLMVSNAKTYNEPDSFVCYCACDLWDVFTETKLKLTGKGPSRGASRGTTPAPKSEYEDGEEENDGRDSDATMSSRRTGRGDSSGGEEVRDRRRNVLRLPRSKLGTAGSADEKGRGKTQRTPKASQTPEKPVRKMIFRMSRDKGTSQDMEDED